MYIQDYALLKCKCVNSKMHVQNTVNQTILLYVEQRLIVLPNTAGKKELYGSNPCYLYNYSH